MLRGPPERTQSRREPNRVYNLGGIGQLLRGNALKTLSAEPGC
jgi:hypothetical protein